LLVGIFVLAAFWPLKLLLKTLTGDGDPFGLAIGLFFAGAAFAVAYSLYKRTRWVYVLVILALASDLLTGASGLFGFWGTSAVIGLLVWDWQTFFPTNPTKAIKV